MNNDNFFLTLMSNSSLNYYNDNKTSGFSVHLAQKIQLTGDWVVALAELHYPYNFFNVTAGENAIFAEYNLKNTQAENSNILEQIEYKEMRISQGFYKNTTCVVKAVNKQLSKLTHGDILSVDELDGRTVIEILINVGNLI